MKRNDLTARQIDSVAIALPTPGSLANKWHDRSGGSRTYRETERDRSLLLLICAGSTVGLLQLYHVYRREAFRRAFSVVADLEGAERAIRDAFLIVWSEGVAFDQRPGSVKDWLLHLVDECARAGDLHLALASSGETML